MEKSRDYMIGKESKYRRLVKTLQGLEFDFGHCGFDRLSDVKFEYKVGNKAEDDFIEHSIDIKIRFDAKADQQDVEYFNFLDEVRSLSAISVNDCIN